MSATSTIIRLRMVLQDMRDTNVRLMGGLPDAGSHEQSQLEEKLARWSQILAGARRSEQSAHAKTDLLARQVPRTGRHRPAKDRHRSAGLLAHELTHTVNQLGKQLAEMQKRISGTGSSQRELQQQADALDELISSVNAMRDAALGKGEQNTFDVSAATQTTIQQMQSASAIETGQPLVPSAFHLITFLLIWTAVIQTALRKRK